MHYHCLSLNYCNGIVHLQETWIWTKFILAIWKHWTFKCFFSVSLSVTRALRGVLEKTVALKSVFVSLTLAFSLLQIMVNIALAYDRYYATKYPLDYRQKVTIGVWKKRLLAGAIMCIIFGFGFGTAKMVSQKEAIFQTVLKSHRILSIILLPGLLSISGLLV